MGEISQKSQEKKLKRTAGRMQKRLEALALTDLCYQIIRALRTQQKKTLLIYLDTIQLMKKGQRTNRIHNCAKTSKTWEPRTNLCHKIFVPPCRTSDHQAKTFNRRHREENFLNL